MRKVLKNIGIILLLLAFLAVGILLYVFREQGIDISYIPNEFEYCGKDVFGSDKDYQEIVSWLKQNKEGWVLSYASYVPNYIYHNPAFRVNVQKGMVVVSYKTDYGYPQYVKSIKHGLRLNCENNS